MKKIIVKCAPLLIFFISMLFAGVTAFAQSTDDIADPAVSGYHGKHVYNLYSGPLPFIILGVMFAILVYIGYRYFHDHALDMDSDINTYE